MAIGSVVEEVGLWVGCQCCAMLVSKGALHELGSWIISCPLSIASFGSKTTIYKLWFHGRWLLCDDLLRCKIYLLVVYVLMAKAIYLNICLHTNPLFLGYYNELGLGEDMVGFARVLHSM